MNTTSLHIKIEASVKRQAQETADELGLSLSAVLKALLKQFIRTKRLALNAIERPEIPNARTRRALQQSLEDVKSGRVMSFKTGQEALDYLNKEINDKNRASH